MHSFWLVAKHEYRRTVIRRGFLIGTLALPLGLAILIAVLILVEEAKSSNLPVGYVDHAGMLKAEIQSSLPDPEDRVVIQAYPDDESAMTALKSEQIQAVFVLPPDYIKTLHTDLYYMKKPPSDIVWGQFDDFMRLNLSATLSGEVQERVFSGPEITVIDITNNRHFSNNSWINTVIPFAASFLFFIATMSTASYMLLVVADEKENRTIEIMVTSLTPGQLIGGKVIGLLATAMTQLLVYLIAVVVALIVATPYVKPLQQATVPWTYLGIMALFFLPTYTLISATMVAIGGAVTEVQQGQQVAGFLSLLIMLPIFLTGLIFENPSHPLIITMTFFPATAFLTISLRWGLATIPYWQLGVSWIILVATAVGMVWAAAHIFRVGMLQFGQPLNLRTVLAALKGN